MDDAPRLILGFRPRHGITGTLSRAVWDAARVFPRHDYVLTDRGEGLLLGIIAMQEFGDRHLLGDGSLTAAPGERESERVHALLGSALPTTTLTAQDREHVQLGTGGDWQVLYCFPGAYVPDTDGYPPGGARSPAAPWSPRRMPPATRRLSNSDTRSTGSARNDPTSSPPSPSSPGCPSNCCPTRTATWPPPPPPHVPLDEMLAATKAHTT